MTPREILWRPHRYDWQDGNRILWVSMAALDASWREDGPYHLPPMLGAVGRYTRFGHWLQTSNPRRRVKMPIVGWCIDHVSFEDGRHRTAWCRDHGATALPILVSVEDFDTIAARCATKERRTIVHIEERRAAA